MSTSTTLHNDGESEQNGAIDKRWLDEYAKRGLLANSYAAISNGYLWGIGFIAGSLILKKIAKENIAAHPLKTPLNLTGIAILGYFVACWTQDQVTQKNRMRAERLARRMVLDAEGDNAPSFPSITSGKTDREAHRPVKWREVLQPGWLANRFPAEDRSFERRWYYKMLSTRLKRSFFGASMFGSFTAALTFASSKLIAYAGNELVKGTPAEGDKGTAYHKFHTPAATALMMAVGLAALYKFKQQETKEKILEDNYIARQVARRKGSSSPITRDNIALNTGEPMRGEDGKAEKMVSANKQWYDKYLKLEYKYGFFDEISKATFLGMFANFTKMLLNKAAGKKVSFHGTRTPFVFASMMGFGSLCAYAAYHNESKLVKMSDDRLAELMKDDSPAPGSSGKTGRSIKPSASGAGAASASDTSAESPGGSAPIDLQEYDRKWLKSFRTLSFQEALCLALANATFFGMFSKISNMRLDHVAGKKIYLDNLRSPLVMGSMAMTGIGITYIANTRTAMLQKLEDDRLGFRVNAPEEPSRQQTKQTGLHDGAAPPENFEEYDKKWLARYRNFAFQKALYDAISNATFLGMFSSMSTLLLDKIGGKPMAEEFSPSRSPLVMGGLMSVGTGFAYMAQAKGASIKKLHSDRLAHRVKAEETEDAPEQRNGRIEQDSGKRLIRPSVKKVKTLNAHSAGIRVNPALPYWQQRVERTRNLSPKAFGLCA